MRFHRAKERRLLQSNSISAFYKHVNSKMSCRQRIAPIRASDGSLLVSDAKNAEAFNAYFSTVFTRCNSQFDISSKHSPVVLSNEIPFTADVVSAYLRKAKHKYSAGPDAIPSAFWANIADAVALPVSVIFSVSYSFSILPTDWKCACVTPLFKKGDPSVVSNYRPISLMCTLGKIMETIIRENLVNFALVNNLVSDAQHGFLPGRSTCTQMLECKQ
jgi:hypothetical protein